VPGMGTFVRVLDNAQVRSLFRTRRALEPLAAADAARHITAQQLEQLRQVHQRLCEVSEALLREQSHDPASSQTWQEAARCDVEFHLLITECSGDYFVQKFLSELGAMTGLVLFGHNPTRDWHDALRESNQEHQ